MHCIALSLHRAHLLVGLTYRRVAHADEALGGPKPEGARGKPQDGSSAAKAAYDKLRFLERNWCLPVAVAAAKAVYTPSIRPPQPAIPPKVRALATIEWHLVRSVLPPGLGTAEVERRKPIANVMAGILFLAYAVSRVEQAQSCYVEGYSEGYLWGVFLLDKHPNPLKPAASPYAASPPAIGHDVVNLAVMM